jgi:uncharacterized protein YqeY
MLADQLREDLTAAMKAHDTVATSTLRLALSRIKEAEVSGKTARTLDDDEVLKVLARQVKERDEAIEAFDAAGRTDRADDERAQRAVLAQYLPAPLSDDDLVGIIAAELTAAGLASPSDMGQAMKLINAQVAGRADGKKVAGLVRAHLAG